jgi:hypothetical protein
MGALSDCELHAFVAADKQKQVQRLYWVQFEGYLPIRPELKHTYGSPRHATIGGLDFYVDTWVNSREEKSKPDSDGEHIRSLISEHQYMMPEGMICVRLVHLLDEAKRQELMIIYGRISRRPDSRQPISRKTARLTTNGRSSSRV